MKKSAKQRRENIDAFEKEYGLKEATETSRLFHKMQKSTFQQNLAFSDGDLQDPVTKKIKRSERNDTELYKGLISQFGFDDPRDNTIINLKDNQTLGEALKGKTADSAIEII